MDHHRPSDPSGEEGWEQADRECPGGRQRCDDILGTGCQWLALPKELPPKSTVNDYFRRWTDDRTLDRIRHALYVACREKADREASPTVAIIDSQSVKGAEKGGSRLTRMAMTQARRSRARSGMSL